VIPALIEGARDPNNDVQYAAYRALVNFGAKSVPALINATMHPKKEAVPEMIRTLKAKDSDLRWAAAHALGRIGLVDEAILPALLNALKDKEEPLVRSYAVQSLGRFGPKANTAIPALVDTLKSTDVHDEKRAREIRQEALKALGKMGPDGRIAVPAMIEILANDRFSSSERGLAALALGNLGSAAKEAVPALTQAVQNRSAIFLEAREALRKIKKKG
jgi:HEAT repeat protein